MSGLFGVLFSAILGAGEVRAAPTQLNVIVVDICSARADHFGVYGYPGRTTPGIDAMAKEAAVFENAMAQGSWCLSNYASLFTGRKPEVHGLYAMAPRKLPESLPTMAQKMKEAGYATAGYSGGTWLLPVWGLDKGFDHYVNTLSTWAGLSAFSQRMPDMLEWIRARDGAPFFLYASIEDLHLPYAVELSLITEVDGGEVVLGADFGRAPLLRGGAAKVRELDPPPPNPGLKPTPADPDPRLVAKYDRALARADRQIAAFIRELKARGLWDRTVFILTGDHGESLGEHGLRGHMEGLYEEILHVPLIVHHPGLPQAKGKRFAELIERVDLMPTVLEAAGVSVQGLELSGRSLLPLMRGAPVRWRKYAFAASKRSTGFARDFLLDERVVRTRRWKLHWYAHKGRYELYDLKNDPRELRDLSEKRPDIVGSLSFQLIRHIEAVRPRGQESPELR